MAGIPSVQRRRLASELRALRESADLTIDQVAQQVTIGKSTLSRVENAQVSVTPRNVAKLLRLYGVADDDAAGLIQLAHDAQQYSWWNDYSNAMSDGLAGYVAFEDEATQLRAYDVQLVNGLLQTAEYTRALLQAEFPEGPPEKIEERVEIRLARQRILDRSKPPRLWFVLDEAVLHRPVGGPQVMAAQLGHLITTAQRPSVTVQVLPFRQGAHMGMGVSFALLDFGDHPTVVYQENLSGALYLDKDYHVDTHGLAFDHLRATALSPADTLAFLRMRAEVMLAQGARESPNDDHPSWPGPGDLA
ncbi:helix-turn-helix transcriptional regulator [Solwaraspora sp. WMMD406]|uniref:helix-turn-helix domain-containing protein n=1 Tax=Solwaraspora sp. WMMD406 TaxID=3016095 RepID=UPI002415C37F|nr:helix-turn-helix transcriptional regulator [Solwaraspora sp. WMMD406]MDG4763762.1 helix-turn-helix transcriptional regulator [Solwaraspora sp. WMMD406]